MGLGLGLRLGSGSRLEREHVCVGCVWIQPSVSRLGSSEQYLRPKVPEVATLCTTGCNL